jgi:soluble lytic murein transglycosylase
MRRTALLAISAVIWACTPTQAAEPGEAKMLRSDARAAPVLPPPTPAELGWIRAVREQRFADAARAFDAVEPAPTVPELRYARARIAVELKDHARALELLRDLDPKLPDLSTEVLAMRARAQLEVGPYVPAAEYYLAQGDAGALITAATAYERAGDLTRATQAVDRALGLIKKVRRQTEQRTLEARARMVRARLRQARRHDTAALADLRWIATVVPTSPEAAAIDESFAALCSRLALSPKERYARALSWAELGLVEQTDRELDHVMLGKRSPIPEGDVAHARAFAWYMSRQDDAKASELFEQAAKLGSRDVARDLYYAARARSRINELTRATALYDEIAQRFPKSGWAEQARYLAARSAYIGGQWPDAAARYARYLTRFGARGKFAEAAEYELAISELAAGSYGQAAARLQKLASATDDAREAAALTELYGVAVAGAGRRDEAVALLRGVIESQPLSLPALFSAARLRALDAPVPVVVPPARATPTTQPELKLELPPKVRLLQRLGLDDDAERELSLHEPALRRALGARAGEGLCRLYETFFGAARRYRVGQQLVPASLLQTAPTAETRWAWDCIYPRPYSEIVNAAETQWRLPPGLIYAVMRQESSFQPGAQSPVRASGLMQLMPTTAQRAASEIGVEHAPELLRSPLHNVRLGAYYLGRVLETFGGQAALAAAAYNAGPTAVSHWLASGEQLPLDVFVARIPYRETRTYVARVVGNWTRYLYLDDGDAAVPKLALEIPKGLRAPPDAY